MRIRVLDAQTANQIAAGEVVERPASVVKELVENSLDAGATRITVEVNEGGKSLIRITDDGHGMSPEDARLCLERHATSKIRTADDLVHITTLGFRGEAVPSIASVSKFEIVTREPDAVAGYRVLVEGGHIAAEGEIGAPVGTRITVQDLFYNTPARLKYLKTNATEMSQIGDILTRHAMAHPAVSFRLITGGTQVFITPGSGRVEDAALGLLGRETIKGLLPVELGDMTCRVTGYVGAPSLARSGRSHQFFFVNGRPIKQFAGRHALEEAYAHLIPGGKYPVCVLFIEVPPEEVDVNVHPTKAEVRFVREREVRSALFRAAREALGQALLVPGVEGQKLGPETLGQAPAAPAERDVAATLEAAPATPYTGLTTGFSSDRTQGYTPPTPAGANARQGWVPPGAHRPGQGGTQAPAPPWQRRDSNTWNAARDAADAPAWPGAREAVPTYVAADAPDLAPTPAAIPFMGAPQQATILAQPTNDQAALIRSLRPLGQIHRSYIACDGPGGLYVIDQHAAHERIFFERLLDAAMQGEEAVQPLLFPLTLELTPMQLALWQEQAPVFAESGFRGEPFGGNTLLVNGVPASLGSANPATLVVDFLDRVADQKIQPGTNPLERRRRVLAALAACKAAIKAHDALQPEDIAALLVDLAACQSPTTCPHGRPTVIALPIAELEKRFGRT